MSRVTYICENCGYAIPEAAEWIAENDRLKSEIGSREGEKQEMRAVIDRYREALTELARFDTEPKYLANGHDEVARLARQALLGGNGQQAGEDGEAK